MSFKKQEDFIDEPLALTTAVKLTKDLKIASTALGVDQGRFLVKQYYTMQENRIGARHQGRTLAEKDMPYTLLSYVGDQCELIELQIKAALGTWVSNDPVGQWLQSIVGIGPVIAAGLIAHIDITKAPTAGSVWRFAGLDPTVKWEKGQKRPWNADLKVLAVYKAGESFVKVQNNANDFYGHIYVTAKKRLTTKNELGGFKDVAANLLATKKYRKETEAYKAMIEGRLCKAHIHAMARRKAVKIFLSHLHEIMFWHHYKFIGPAPYPIVHLEGHVHDINIPNMQMFPGMAEAREAQLLAIQKLPGKQINFVNTPQELEKVLQDEDDWSVAEHGVVDESDF